MTNVTKRVTSKTRFDTVIPVGPYGATHTDLRLALHLAEQDFKVQTGRDVSYDDDLRVFGDEEEITIRFEIDGKAKFDG